MLSTAQDYRPGVFSEQIHAWQATLDEHAIVFTTHPKNEPHEDTRWPDSDGYWTGIGFDAACRAARCGGDLHLRAAVRAARAAPRSLRLPRLHARVLPAGALRRGRADGHWTFGRKGDGYVALWSQRAVRLARRTIPSVSSRVG